MDSLVETFVLKGIDATTCFKYETTLQVDIFMYAKYLDCLCSVASLFPAVLSIHLQGQLFSMVTHLSPRHKTLITLS